MKRHRSPVVLLLVLLGVAGAVWAGPKEEVARRHRPVGDQVC